MTTNRTQVHLDQAVPLGPFRVDRFIGRGGMGMVWHGVHEEQRVPVAVKVLPRDLTARARSLAWFRAEVRKCAQFEHPGIVRVFDYGEIPEAAARLHADQLDRSLQSMRMEAGSPYLVMEFCDGGSLTDRLATLDWEGTRGVLLALLDALAHAHARGVVHRDIKPDNILFAGGVGETTVKLSDFGIALDDELDDEGRKGQITGTLPYMAPEQFQDWRDQGPWTDLYALGCVTFRMATGQPPFTCASASEFAARHLFGEVPPMTVPAGFPSRFEGWVQRLLLKDPRRRFRCAADAAHALTSLEVDRTLPVTRLGTSTTKASPQSLERRTDVGPTFALARTVEATPEELTTMPAIEEPTVEAPLSTASPPGPGVAPAARVAPEPTGGDTAEAMPAHPAPVPVSWSTESPPLPPMSLIGAGIGLYEWKTVPLTGRIEERDRIWETLRGVIGEGKSRLLLLQGQAGYGKSRLASWMAQRAQEVGGTLTVMRAHHSPGSGTGGVSRMLAEQLRCVGLGADDLTERVETVLKGYGGREEYEVRALTAFVSDGAVGRIRFRNPVERFLVVRRHLDRLCQDRTVVLLLEDVQWGGDALALAQFLMRSRDDHPLPLLILLTAREEQLQERVFEAELLAELLSGEGSDSIGIGPLPPSEQAELVQQLLRLEGGLADRVRKRTGGNPLFAVQLVDDWIRRGVLAVGRTGFVLAPGEKARIPARIHSLWQGRLKQVLDGEHQGAATAMVVASALGNEVNAREWSAACEALEIVIPPTLLESLLAAHLAEIRDWGWAFGHGMFRESVARGAEGDGTWATANRACAQMLAERMRVRGSNERIGRHLLAADDLQGAYQPLLDGVHERLDISDYRIAAELLADVESLLDELDVPDVDERRGHAWVARVRVEIGLGRYEEAVRSSSRVAETARRNRWRVIHPKALRYQAVALQKKGELGLAETVLVRAHMECLRYGDAPEQTLCLLHLSSVSRMLGDLPRALEHGLDAVRLAEQQEDRLHLAECLAEVGNIRLAAGSLVEAGQFLHRALALFEEVGYPYGIAHVRNSMAEISRQCADLERAETEYLQAQEMLARVGSPERIIPMLNGGLLKLSRGDYDGARVVFEEGLTIVRREQRRHLQGCVHVALMLVLAHAGEWDAFDRHGERATTLVAETGATDRDIAWPAHRAGKIAFKAGEFGRAAMAYRLALPQWVALGREQRATVVRGRLDECRAKTRSAD